MAKSPRYGRRIRKLAPDTPIIGMGGIASGRDIMDYVKAGADAVGIGTAFDLKSTAQVGEFMGWLVGDLKEELGKEGVGSLKQLRRKSQKDVE